MLEPIQSDNMVFDSDSCKISFFYIGNDLQVLVTNHTSKRAFIEWENARLDFNRVVFGDDTRLTMRNAKADESIPANSSSIMRIIMSEGWVDSYHPISIYNLRKLKQSQGEDLEVVIPVRFGDREAIDFRFRLGFYYHNPVDSEQVVVGMKERQARKILGAPDDFEVNKGKVTLYYATNIIVRLERGVVTEVERLRIPFTD